MNRYKIRKVTCFLMIVFLLQVNFLSLAISTKDDGEHTIATHHTPFSFLKTFLTGRRRASNMIQLPFFVSTIRTTCGSVEKTTQIMFGQFNDIDVDNDVNTGVNGRDIRIQYLLLPAFEFDPDLKIGIRFFLMVQRIGDEIRYNPFSLSSDILDGMFELGYQSPLDHQIPHALTLSSFLFLSLETGSTGVSFEMNPAFEDTNQDHTLSFFTSYTDGNTTNSYELMFEPSCKSTFTIESTGKKGVFHYSFLKQSSIKTIVTLHTEKITNEEHIETTYSIHPSPTYAEFTLGISPFSEEGGSVEYQSDSVYDTTIRIESNNMGICQYATVKNTPRYLYAEWDPSKEDGFYYLTIDADDTDIFLIDTLENPTINLSIHGIKDVAFTAFWNFTNPGDFTVRKDTAFHINLDVIIDVWEARIDAEPTAENIQVTWLTDVSGYVTYDTNWEPLQEIDLLVKGSDVGIRTIGEYFKAEDFMLEWTIWPPVEWNINASGEIEFHSIIIEVYIDGTWYQIWPW